MVAPVCFQDYNSLLQTRKHVCRPLGLELAVIERRAAGLSAPVRSGRAVELLPVTAQRSDAQPPPASHAVRTALFVDCVGSIPLRVYGVEVGEGQTMASIKEALWQHVRPGEVCYMPLRLATCVH